MVEKMKERPIIYNSEMVRAILNDQKTQTRRIIRQQPPAGYDYVCGNNPENRLRNLKGEPVYIFLDRPDVNWPFPEEFGTLSYPDKPFPSAFGQPGDCLWVRETWYNDTIDSLVNRISLEELKNNIYYKADGEPHWEEGGITSWKPSIHMPRWASRILLRIKNIRVERLQDISERDAIAEGIMKFGPRSFGLERWSEFYETAIFAFQRLWESIHGSGSWEKNPWVWVLEFEKINSRIKV